MDEKKETVTWKWYRNLFILFAVLTVAGLIYVIAMGGDENLEYTMMPMVISMIFYSLYQEKKKGDSEKETKKN